MLRGHTHHETVDIYGRRPWASTVLALPAVPSPCLIVRRAWRCSRQHRRWPWTDNDCFMNVPLGELRSTFGIRVAHEERA